MIYTSKQLDDGRILITSKLGGDEWAYFYKNDIHNYDEDVGLQNLIKQSWLGRPTTFTDGQFGLLLEEENEYNLLPYRWKSKTDAVQHAWGLSLMCDAVHLVHIDKFKPVSLEETDEEIDHETAERDRNY